MKQNCHGHQYLYRLTCLLIHVNKAGGSFLQVLVDIM